MRLNRLLIVTALIAAAPATAQNATEPSPPAAPPAGKAEPAPVTLPPPPVVTEAPAESAPAENVVVVRETAPPPPEPVTIDPDAAYPNGFADPADPFGNDISLARRDQNGFPWGLLGLLGLLGLVPLFRRGGETVRTVYVDRDDPRRVLREDESR